MTEPFLLYISAAIDLTAERELLSRSVAEMPVDIGWRIVFSPARNEPLNLDHLSQSDFHLLLLAEDIRAPIGLEFQWAVAAGKKPAAFLKSPVNRTPAANEFKRYVSDLLQWQPYKNGPDLIKSILPRIIDRVLDRTNKYRLSSAEQEVLIRWRTDIEKASWDLDQLSKGGAGDSSLIFSIDRFTPSDGVRLETNDRLTGPSRSETGS